MKITPPILALLLLLLPITANSQNAAPATEKLSTDNTDIIPPEIVRVEKVHTDNDEKTLTVGNANKHYLLFCNVKAAGCITPEKDKNYLLFNKNTRWKMPGAKDFITLAFIQDWTVKYNKGENIGLIPEAGGSQDELGLYMRDTEAEKGSYNQDTVATDGPIIYGTGLKDDDRQKAWHHFFLQMVEACGRQQGTDALGLKLARRCMPGDDYCSTAIDANMTGIGGIKEPRKVLLVIVTDVHDQNKQLSRMVCTYPARDMRVCRDWDTGKLMDPNEDGQ